MQEKSPLSKTIVALDNLNPSEVFTFLDKANRKIPTIKLGLELFCLKGPDFVKEIFNRYGIDIFLDLKLHDIPNTVAKAIKSLNEIPIKFLTIHLSGGKEMVNSAINSAREFLPETDLLGVSYLTSLGESNFKELFNFNELETKKSFSNLFTLALKCSMKGVVLSPNELPIVTQLEKKLKTKIIKVTPGIRFADEISSNNIQDQKRVETPESAIRKGADYLVIGRSLTKADDLEKRLLELS